jgi:hypothetical protein
MVIRMRIYQTQGPNPDADLIFYGTVKPIHEKHGAHFVGRYLDNKGRHVVMWSYENEEEMHRIQQDVVNDPETIRNREMRLRSGLHAIDFEEFVLTSTDAVKIIG